MRPCRVAGVLALLAAPLAAPVAAQQPVRWSIVVHPDTVTVGEPFSVTLRVIAPAGATVSFPIAPDSAAAVQPLDPRVLSAAPGAAAMDRSVTYRLAAWDVGTLGLALPDVVVHTAGGDQGISLRNATVFVRSVLPADTSKRAPKPARDLLSARLFPWWIVAVLAAIAMLAWLSWRRRRKATASVALSVSPFERAEREFTRVAALGLVEAGERGRYVSLMVEVLRDYLWARYPVASLSLTTPELLRELADARALPHEQLGALLVETDLIKFARRPLTTDRALDLGREARAIVAHDDAASAPQPAQEAA